MPNRFSRARRIGSVLWCAAASVAVASWATARDATPTIELSPASRLTLSGKSTLHDYTSRATRMHLAVELADGVSSGALARLAGPGAVKSLVLTIPVQGMKSEKEGLDKNMYKALKAEANPNIVFRLASAAANGTAPGEFRLSGALEVAGQTQAVDLDVRASETAEGIVLEGAKALVMSDYGVKPPKMLLGTIKTDPRIVIEWRLVLVPNGF
jgi:hypothetical protein